MWLIITLSIAHNMDYLQTHTSLFLKNKHVSVRSHISTSTPDSPYVCFRSKFMATTGHHSMNKFQRKSSLLTMEEKLAQQQNTGVSLNIMTKMILYNFTAGSFQCVQQMHHKMSLISSNGKGNGKIYHSSKIYWTKLNLSSKQIHMGYSMLLLLLLCFHYYLKLFIDLKHSTNYLEQNKFHS